ncbi:MAG: DUF4184 family protein [Gammaproteobacteria bacterium]|nr:DUF4184 family protein [Gammaproteobacteria bacterium]MBU1646802.1 DUF4184 family protein [Gammaproteobacteria bacterium]MBU1971637.1 DUF4184 family protein [Gammaproteobacteria bacterium]
MPITPFHFGPGLLFKGITRPVSLSAFVVANCAIDIEPIVAFLLTGDPMHRFMHTYLGVTLAAIVTALFAKQPVEWGLRYWNSKLSPGQARWLGCAETVSLPSFWIGALIGAWSHIWLDAFMHIDVQPWSPFNPGNSQQGLISMEALHVLCLLGGVLGLLLLSWKHWVRTSPYYPTIKKWIWWTIGYGLLIYIGYFYYSLATGRERVT